MPFLGKTILLAEDNHWPTNFGFLKIVKYIPDRKKIKVYPKYLDSPPFDATVVDCRVSNGGKYFTCLLENGLSVNTDDHIIVEKEEVKGTILNPNLENIGDVEEDEIIEEIRNDPTLFKKIPKALWDHPSFREKMNIERTKATIRSVDSIGKNTGTVALNLPYYPFHNTHSYVSIKTDPEAVDLARRRKTMLAKQSVRGGTRKRRRRFKK